MVIRSQKSIDEEARRYAERKNRLRSIDAAIASEIFGYWPGQMVVEAEDNPHGDGRRVYPQWWAHHSTAAGERCYAGINLPEVYGLGSTQSWSEDGLPKFSSDYPTAMALMIHFVHLGWEPRLVASKELSQTVVFSAFFGPIEERWMNPAEAIARAALRAARMMADEQRTKSMEEGTAE